jgi:hypothetical protein
MAQIKTYRIWLNPIATQLTALAGHQVAVKDIRKISYDPITMLVTVELAPIMTHIDKIRESFTFTRNQVANFYQAHSGNAISATAITNVAFDSDDAGSYLEIFL